MIDEFHPDYFIVRLGIMPTLVYLDKKLKNKNDVYDVFVYTQRRVDYKRILYKIQDHLPIILEVSRLTLGVHHRRIKVADHVRIHESLIDSLLDNHVPFRRIADKVTKSRDNDEAFVGSMKLLVSINLLSLLLREFMDGVGDINSRDKDEKEYTNRLYKHIDSVIKDTRLMIKEAVSTGVPEFPVDSADKSNIYKQILNSKNYLDRLHDAFYDEIMDEYSAYTDKDF